MIYVDDLLFIGVQNMINTLFSRMQTEVLLRHTGDLNVGSTIHFLGRNISHKGSYNDTSLNNNYVDIILEGSGMTAFATARIQVVEQEEDHGRRHLRSASCTCLQRHTGHLGMYSYSILMVQQPAPEGHRCTVR